MKPHILFDLDGTLTDPVEGITNSGRYALKMLGRPPLSQKELESFIGPPLNENFLAFFPDMPESEVEQAITLFREYFSEKGFWENEIYPGIAQLLATLCQNGASLHLATSKPLLFAQRVLDRFSLAQYFSIVEGSPMAHGGLQKADVIAAVLAQGGFSPADAVMVGDRKHDVLGAKQHAIATVGVLFGYGSREELVTADADCLAADMAELENILLHFS